MRTGRLAAPFRELAQYMREHSVLGGVAAVLVFLVYAKQAFSTDFYVDAEVILNHPRAIYNWGQIGRFGLIALKCLIGGNWYNPYLEAVLFLIALWMLGMAFSWLFSEFCAEVSEGARFLSIVLFLCFPTYADQFLFRFQSFEVVFAMFLIVLATRYLYLAVLEKEASAYAAAVILSAFSFGVYQSMVNLQICAHIAVWLFALERLGKEERKHLFFGALAHLLASLVVYGVIVKLFFDSGDYLSSQVGWISGDVAGAARNVLAYIKRVLFALDVFYPVTYLACVCACAALLGRELRRGRGMFSAYAAGIACMLASPFFLAIATGMPSPYRAQCMLPFVCAALWLFLASRIQGRGALLRACWIAAGCVFLLCQLSVVTRLFYTQDVIRDADEIIAAQMMERIDGLDGTRKKPVVFLGHLTAKPNASCYTKEEAASYLSYSVYEFAFIEGVPVDTPDYFNTGRILGYFETLGFRYEMPTVQMVENAKAAAKSAGVDMGCFPSSDSVREMEQCIVVKLSE